MEGINDIFLQQGIVGAVALVLSIVVLAMARHILSLYKKIEDLQTEWRKDTASSLHSVNSALDTIRQTMSALNSPKGG